MIYAGSTKDASRVDIHATFHSTVLSLRGKRIAQQPLRHSASGSLLCWNGEAWSIGDQVVSGNDSEKVFIELLLVCGGRESPEASLRAVGAVLSSIRGPYAFVYYDASHEMLYYGRDCLGRRSLLRKDTADGSVVLSSVCDNASGESWTEVEADGIYVVKFRDTATLPSPGHIPHRLAAQTTSDKVCIVGESPSTCIY